MKKAGLLLFTYFICSNLFAQIPESESNNTFSTANGIQISNNITATVGTTDAEDYFRTIMPADGTLKVYVHATNISASIGNIYIQGYDRRKTIESFGDYISSNSVGAGITVFDSIILHGQAADTFYFRFTSVQNFSYQFQYIVIDQSPNDAEPNNSFATAAPIVVGETKQGHINYRANGSTYDQYDYYQTIFPVDGTLKIYVRGTNRSGFTNYLYMIGYDRRKTSSSFEDYISSNNVAPGATVYDTITLHGQAADTFYFRLQTAGNAFAYDFRYELVDQSPNDAEPNNSFTTAAPIAVGETKQGHINYKANGSTYDQYDYYQTIFPVDGTLKIYVRGTNRSGFNNYLYMIGYDRRKTSSSFDQYISSNNVTPGATVYDTITLHGQAADTFYFRLQTAGNAFAYDFRYELVDQSPNDAEPNNTFATATPIAVGETKQGHINYKANGSTYDQYDYYQTIFPVDGTLKIYVRGTNRSGFNNYLYMIGYDRRKTNSSFDQYISSNNVAPGATVYDTITLHGQAADTFYFRLQTVGNAFAYDFRYELLDTSLNDAEANNSFAEAISLSGTELKYGHTGYRFNGTQDDYDYYKTVFASTDSLKLYLQATNYSGGIATLSLTGYNSAFSQIYTRTKSNVPNGTTVYDSVKILVTAPQTIYNRLGSSNTAFSYQLSTNGKLPGNGFTISGALTVCNNAVIYKALNIADADISYHWTLVSGGSLSFTDSIATVSWTTPGVHILKLYLSNSYGNSITKQITVTVNDLVPVITPAVIIKGRYLSIATVPAGAQRYWFKDGIYLNNNDSVYYAATAGNYTAKYTNTCGEGPASGSINFNTPQAQTISFPAVSNIGFAIDSFRVFAATSTSGLPISYSIISGSGILRGDSLFVSAAGNIVVQAAQFGNTDYANATPVNISVTVVKGPQLITFHPIPDKLYSTEDFAADAFSSSGLPISYSIVSGPATIIANRIKMNGAGTVQVRASQNGDINYLAAPEVVQSFCIGIRQINPIVGPAISCPTTIRYTTKKITGAIYEWSLSGGGMVTGNGDTAIVQWQTPGSYTLSVQAYSACDGVRSAVQTIAVSVLAVYNTGPVTGLLPADNATGLSLPVALQWSPGTNATSYDLFVWPTGYAVPTIPLDSGLIQINYNLNENIALNIPYSWKVVARNVCSSSSSAVQQFTAVQNSSSRPDLVLDTFSHQATIFQGQPITVTWRVKNNGGNGTGLSAWKDRVYLSSNNSLRVNDGAILLGEFNNPSYLFPGETYTQTKTVTVPQGVAGTWYLFVITDNEEAFCFSDFCNVFWGGERYNHRQNLVTESSELNNYRYDVVSILDGPLPDLLVKSVGVPGAAFGGSNINITYRVKNEGGISAAGKVSAQGCPQRYWRDRFFISAEPTFNINNANELPSKEIRFLKPGTTNCVTETLPYLDYLLPDSSYLVQHQVVLPYNFFGKQYIYVYTNGYNDAYEGPFNTNNIRRSDSINITVTPPVDLVVSNIQNLSNVLSGSLVDVNYTVANQGANEPQLNEAGWSDSIFISSSPSFNYSNILARGSRNQRRPSNFITGATYNDSYRFTLPNGISGTYYVYVKADAKKEVFEFNQENNNTLRSNAFTVALSTPVDMVITSISAPDTVRAELPFNITYTVKNIGAGTVASGWYDSFKADTDSSTQYTGAILGSVYHSANDSLVPNAERTYTQQVVIYSYQGYSNKRVFIKVKTDDRDNVYEHLAEENNVSVSQPPVGGGAIFVKPAVGDTAVDRRSNLKMMSLSASSSVTANTSMIVSWTVKNLGPLATTKTYWQDRLYLSTDTTVGQGDVELKRVSISQYTSTGLLADSQYIKTVNIQIPISLVGNYYLICRTDYNGNVENDSIVDDNNYRIPITIIAAQVPDLVITPLNNPPDSVWGGSVFYLKYSVQNIGVVAAQAVWYDMCYGQNFPISNGFQTGSILHDVALAPGQSYIDSILVRVPEYVSGNYNLYLHTDGSQRVYEGAIGDDNNINIRPITIYPYNNRPAPDLIVSALSIPDSIGLGKDMIADYTITNIGIHPASGNLSDAFYLSANNVYESNLDKLTATAEKTNFMLAPGQSVAAQLTGKALPPVVGNYRSIIRTNARNTLHEGPSINNNIKASDTTTFIDATLLTLNQTSIDTLKPTNGNYYKIVVGDSLDLLIALTTAYNGNGSNAVYAAYNKVADETNFDATGFTPTSLNQQVLLSNTTAGTYYIKAQSVAIGVNEPVSLLITAIPFSIVSATPAVMGQGRISGLISGGGFKQTTQIILRKNGVNYNAGTVQQFVNSTRLKMAWNLTAVPTGVYDVVAINPGNIEQVLTGAITVETIREYDLEYTPLIPSELRPYAGVFTYKGKNRGNVNIDVLQGDVTMIAKNATIHKVSTTGRIRRYTKYIPQADSLITEDWYLSGDNRVVPFIGRNIAPGEEFTITIETRFKGTNVITEQKSIFPLQCRMIGYSSKDFARDQVRNLEMMRLLLMNHPRAVQHPNSRILQDCRSGSKVFIEKMLHEYVTAGLLQWTDTIGLSLRWNCSRCLQILPENKPLTILSDTMTFNPKGNFVIGKDLLGTGQVFGKNQSYLVEMNRGKYWWYFNGPTGQPGEAEGWDLLDINGTLLISATAAEPFKIYPSSLSNRGREDLPNEPGQLAGWSPAYDTSYLIVKASGGINGYQANKFLIDLKYFSDLNHLRQGRFSTEFRPGYGLGADSILLVWTAYKPTWGEAGVDGVDGGPGQPGSPGGVGGPGNAQHPKGGKGGKGGRGSDQFKNTLAQPGGRGGRGGKGYGSGGDGGDAGKTGNVALGNCPASEIGGEGEDAGPAGGGGGNGGVGGEGCNNDRPDGPGGGKGGDGGDGVNSSYGGRGGDGGRGGKGQPGCGSGKPGAPGGDGGTGGSGPLGSGSDGSSGPKGIFGPSFDCPPCSATIPSTDGAKEGEALIDYGKASYGFVTGALGGDNLAYRNIAIEVIGQSAGEYVPGAKLIVDWADLSFDLLVSAGTAEYTLAMKGIVFALKVGDYAATGGGVATNTYPGQPVVKFLITGLTAISSPADFVATALKLIGSFGDLVYATIQYPCDPNDIIGPTGYDNERFISSKAVMPYTINFENDSLATVSAQRVVVRQPISQKADPLTLKLGNFNFGGNTFEVPENRSNYFTTLNFDSLGYRVEVAAGVDITNREVFWILQAIDPATGLPPSNIFTGFLPPNDSTEKGTGFVTYSIKPKTTVVTGDSITAKASIVFDENIPIETNTWVNIIDAFPPVSSIANLPDSTPDTEVTINYTGIDDLGGSGIQSFNLYVSDNGAPQVKYLSSFTGIDTTFIGEVGHTYHFYGEAIDNVGNVETKSFLDSVKIVTGQQVICPGANILFDAKINGASYQWQVNTGAGFTNVVNGGVYTGATNSKLNLTIPPTSMYGYQYRCVVNGNTYSDVFLLKFGMTWDGTESNAWENTANWSCNSLPDANTDVIVNGSKPNYPVINSNVTIRTLRLNPGATGTVNTGFILNVLK